MNIFKFLTLIRTVDSTLLPLGFLALLIVTILEYLFMISLLSVLEQINGSIETKKILGVEISIELGVIILACKIALQVLSTSFLLWRLKILLEKLMFKSIAINLSSLAVSSSEIIRVTQHDCFYFGEFFKNALLLSMEILLLMGALSALTYTYGVNTTLFLLLLIAIFSLVSLMLGPLLTNLGKYRGKIIEKTVSMIPEFKVGWPLVVTSRKIDLAFAKISRVVKEIQLIDFKRALISHLPKNMGEIIILFLLVLFLLFPSEKSMEIVSLILVLSLRAIPILGRATGYLQSMFFSWSSLTNFFKLQEVIESNIESGNQRYIFYDWNEIRLKNLNYKIGFRNLFDKLSLSIKKGEKLAIVGRNGSGKSTLIKLLIGLVPNQGAQLTLDGQRVNSLQRKIALSYISQDPIIFSGSVYENITLDFDLSKDKTKIAQIGYILKKLSLKPPKGYSLESYCDIVIGPESKLLSGGEIQIMALVRAIYLTSSIIFIDEGNSALDIINEKKTLNALIQDKDLTVVYVTHRHDLLTLFDKIINLDVKKR